MIREHQFRGEDLCTYKWHNVPHGKECGKPREEHAEIAFDAKAAVQQHALPPRKRHLWGSVVLRVHNVPTPVNACTRPMCFVKWWPNRGEPLGDCQGL